jgi:AraC-like DNA-binding protein
MHLFKSAAGVPLRRYVLWARIAAVVRAAIAGESLTQAALGAGFSSSAHFSAVFREMFGLSPSQLLRQVRLTGFAPTRPSRTSPQQ